MTWMQSGRMLDKISPTIVVGQSGARDYDNIHDGLDALPSGGGWVFVKEGTYTITAAIAMTDNVMLSGVGYATVIQLGASVGEMNAIDIDGDNNLIIRDLRIDGNEANNGGAAHNGIIIKGTSDNIQLDSLWIHNFTNYGIHLYGFGSTITNIVISRFTITGCHRGIYAYALASGDRVSRLVHGYCEGNTLQGIMLNDSDYMIIHGNTLMNNGSIGLRLWDGKNNTIIGNIIEGNTGDGISLENSSKYNAIQGNLCANNSAWGIDESSGDWNKIIGNPCEGNTTGTVNKTGANTEIGHN